MEFKNKSGYVMPVIGRQECGKSPFVKQLNDSLNFKNSIVNDVNDEYDKQKFSNFNKDEKEYIKYISDLTHSFIIIEEAGEIFNKISDYDTKKLLGRIAHNFNVCVPIFLLLMDTPKSVLAKSRYVTLFPTLDDEKDIKTNRFRYYDFFMNQNKPIVIDNYNMKIL